MQEEYKNDIILSLAGDLSITIEEAVSDFCENTVRQRNYGLPQEKI